MVIESLSNELQMLGDDYAKNYCCVARAVDGWL